MPEFEVTEEMSPYGAKIRRERLRRAAPLPEEAPPPEVPPEMVPPIPPGEVELPPVPPSLRARVEERVEPTPSLLLYAPRDVQDSLARATVWSLFAMGENRSPATVEMATLMNLLHRLRLEGNEYAFGGVTWPIEEVMGEILEKEAPERKEIPEEGEIPEREEVPEERE